MVLTDYFNAPTWNRQDWEQYSVGIVDFYYPHYHKLIMKKLKKLHTFILDLCSHLGVPPKTVGILPGRYL